MLNVCILQTHYIQSLYLLKRRRRRKKRIQLVQVKSIVMFFHIHHHLYHLLPQSDITKHCSRVLVIQGGEAS